MILLMCGTSSIVKAARVNKSWAEVALGMLYTSVTGKVFRGLGRMVLDSTGSDRGWVSISCAMHRVFIPEDYPQVFRETPSPYAWSLFQSNRHRVRELDIRAPGGQMRISARAMGDIAQTRPDFIIFPFLRRLRSSARQLTPLLMSPSVVDLWVDMEAMDPCGDMSDIRTLVDRICIYFPQLETLHIDSGPRFHRCGENMIRLFDCLVHLREVVLPGQVITPELLCCLSQLPELIDLQVSTSPRNSIILADASEASSLDWEDVMLFSGAFPKLRRFTSCFLSTVPSIRTFTHVQFPAHILTDVALEFAYGLGKECEGLKVFMDAVAPHFLALESLSIRFSELMLLSGGTTATTPQCLHFADICGFLHFPSLTSFSIDHPCPIRMSEDDAYTVAMQGRRFEEIFLSATPRWADSSALLRLSALIPFATYCPRLRRLGLCMDCSAPCRSPPEGAKFVRIIELHVGESLVSSQRRRMYTEWITVARYLAGILTFNCKIVASLGGSQIRSSGTALRGWKHEDYPFLGEAWTAIAGMMCVVQDTRVRMAAEEVNFR